jgi:hypothetical protein
VGRLTGRLVGQREVVDHCAFEEYVPWKAQGVVDGFSI